MDEFFEQLIIVFVDENVKYDVFEEKINQKIVVGYVIFIFDDWNILNMR